MIEPKPASKLEPQDLIDALKSGLFNKTTGTLERVNEIGESKFCCLGVLCNIIEDTERVVLDDDGQRIGYVWKPRLNDVAKHSDESDEDLARWFTVTGSLPSGLTDEIPWMTEAFVNKLIRLNDNSDTWDEVIERLEVAQDAKA